MKLSRLSGRKRNAWLLRSGNVFRGKTLMARWHKSAPRHPHIDPEATGIYVGTLASTKLDKSAVKRNRMRRRCREALRKAVIDWPAFGPVQIVLAPKKQSLDCSWSEIEADILNLLQIISR